MIQWPHGAADSAGIWEGWTVKRKILPLVVCLAAVFLLLPTAARADTGPKPSVSLSFSGMGDRVYYTTLLSREKSTGPFSFSTEPIEGDSYLVDGYREDGLKAWQAFRNYADADGFYFLEYFQRCSEQNTFSWSYYPPDTFKVLVYFPDEDRFVSSGILEKYAFDSYYRVQLSADGSALTAEKNYDYAGELAALAARTVLTVGVEILVALLFRLREKKTLLFILAVNAVTQIVLNVLLNLVRYSDGPYAYIFNYVWMELLVVLLEAVVFSVYFRKARTEKPVGKWVAPVYSLAANTASFAAGLLLSLGLPEIF